MKRLWKNWLYDRKYFLLFGISLLSLIGVYWFLFFEKQKELSYFFILTLFLLLVYVIADIYSIYRRYQRLQTTLAIQDTPQIAIGPIEALLVDALKHTQVQYQTLVKMHQQEYNEQLDYYTLWSHQIKTPITAALLVTNQLAGAQKNTLQQQLFKIQEYTDFVLHYLRMETFHQDLVLKEENIDNLVKMIIKKYMDFFIHKQIRVQLTNLNETLVTDSKWFHVMFEQFISNAVKYTQNGQVHIYIENDYLVIEDTGVGIRAEDVPRVFDRGFSGYNGRISEQSSGLGLYLARKIGQQLGIAITIDSVLHKGTIVKLNIKQQRVL